MDTLPAVELAVYICQFVDVATKCLATVRNLDTSSDDSQATNNNQGINNLTTSLLEQAGKVKFQLADDAGFLSQEDEILLRLASQCQKVSSQLHISLERTEATSSPNDQLDIAAQDWKGAEDLQLALDGIKEGLNEQLAPYLWASISEMIRELGAKNSRLNANRTTEFGVLRVNTNTYLQQIKSRDFEEGQASGLWSQTYAAVQKIVDYSTEQVILSTLHFWTMDRRKDLISKQYENTFEWILEDRQSDNLPESSIAFVDWLRTEESLYWISGKPGSGKSTLMKFIAESPKTMDALRQWAAEDKLSTACFYFWSSAKDPLQKSDTGLLRSILFQILRQCPDLIAYAFPELWQERQSQGSLRRFTRTPLSTSDLLAAYQRFANMLPSTKVKFCFFIDGLDEFDGDPTDIIRLINLLSKTKNLKACISSRQWADFEMMFGGSNPWKLYVHQFTRTDITRYVKDLLYGDQRFNRMKEINGEDDAESLAQNIVENAEGVFLWVFLVVRSLLNTLAETDHVSDLQNRLATIPKDIEEYFKKMLLDIEPSIRGKTAEVFEITLQAAEKLPLMCYWFIEEESKDSIANMKVQPLCKEAAAQRLRQIQTRLDTYSQGLLKLNNIGASHSSFSEAEELQWLFDFRVDFLHRTVADFFLTVDMRKMLRKWSGEYLNTDFKICKASLATIEITPSTSIMFAEAPHALSILHLFLSHAKLLEQGLQIALVNQCVSCLKIHATRHPDITMMILGPGNYWAYDVSFDFAILYHCISYGLGEYVSIQLDRGVQFPEPPSGLLSGCFSWDPRVRMGKFTLNFETVELLLQQKLDPNLPWGDRNLSFWQQILGMAYSNHLKGMLTQADCDAIMCSIDHGADLEALVEVYGSRGLETLGAGTVIEKVFPREQYLALITPHPSYRDRGH